MKDFQNYLKSNNIIFETKDNQVSIDGETYTLAIPKNEVFFTESFKLDVEQFLSDYCVILLGSEYYRVKSELIDKPVLDSMRYLGKTSLTATYTSLGVHGGYEICNGTRLYEDWAKKAKFMGIKALGICEKNTLAGLLKFQVACEKAKIKPVLGATFSVFRKNQDLKYDIKCFVINAQGYQNLLWINTQINVINYGYVNESDLMKHGEGLEFVLDPKSLNHEDIFPLDVDFCRYYQLDSVVYEKEDERIKYLKNLREYVYDKRLEPVSLTDSYYLDKRDFYIKDKANSIHQVFEKRATNQYLKSKAEYYEELTKVFSDSDMLYTVYNSALVNEIRIADACEYILPLNERHLPEYKMTKAEAKKYKTNQDLFWAQIKKGLKLRIKKNHSEYLKRLKKEYAIILSGGILDYFLILWDIINYCERNHILIGVGRGSAGGSLIAYLLGIIKIDPIVHGLIFERFLNPGRIKVSLPDIDIDFPGMYRDQIKHYIEKRYGLDYVCSVGTYSNLKIKSLIKDLARQKNIPAHQMDALTAKMDDKDSSFTALLKLALKKKEIKEFVRAHPDIIDAVPLLLNQPRSTSIHASAVIIVPKEKTIFESFPVKRMQKGKETFIVSEFEGEDLDKLGYLKEDILGITQLDKFQFVVDQHFLDTGIRVDIYSLPLDDKMVYSYFQKGWNADVFHFGSQLQQDYCKKLKPTEIGHLISANALLRPGPMDPKNKFHEKYLINKNDPTQIEYLLGLEEITKDTYGLIYFQETIMQICATIANFSMEDSDSVRKAMGKKLLSVLEGDKNKFIQGAKDNGYNDEYAQELWHTMLSFAAYAFNKSHATAYAIMGYYCQYLKVHYPVYFWAASFKYRSEQKAHELMPRFISEINEAGVVKLNPANINRSLKEINYDIKNSQIYWTLDSVFFCGNTAIDQILEYRKKDGLYQSFDDFLKRNIHLNSKVNKRNIENMVLSGVFDEMTDTKEAKDRLSLITHYRTRYKVKVDKKRDWISQGKYLEDNWYFQYCQKVFSEFGFIDYCRFLKKLGCEECVDYDDLMTDKYLGDHITVPGYVVNVFENSCVNGVFASVILDINYCFLNVLIWPDAYENLEFKGSKLKRKLVMISGVLEYDKHKSTNVLKSNDRTEITIITQ